MSSATKVKTHSLLSGNLVEEDEKNLSVPKEAQVDDDDNNNNVKDTDLDDDDILNIDDNDIDATELMDENDNSDSSSSNESSRKLGDISYHPTRMIVLYSPPVQRQYWDMEQVLPRVNWGDLFFDLFYVAATYNVSNIIVLSPDRFGFLYSIGTYWPLQGIILHRTTYDARFVIEKDDVYHRLFQIVHFLVLSIGVLTIRSVDIMSHPKLYSSMFTFALSLVVERIMVATRYIEVYFTGIGQPTLKVFAKREILNVSIALPFYIAATIIAGIEFFHNNENNSVTEYGYNNVNNYNATTDYNMTSKVDNSDTSTNVTHIDGGHMLFQRWLAGGTDNKSKDDHSPNHAPIYLLLFGYIASVMFYGLAIICCLPSGGRHKEM